MLPRAEVQAELRQLNECCARANPGTARQQNGLLLSIPIAPIEAPTALRLPHANVLWAHGHEGETVAFGHAQTFETAGSSRFDTLRQDASAFLDGLSPIKLDRALKQEARAFGGFSFTPQDHDSIWKPFGDAKFIVPRFRYERCGERASLSLCLTPEELADSSITDSRLEELLSLKTKLLDLGSIASESNEPSAPTCHQDQTPEQWHALVTEILRVISDGQAKKIVAARRAQLTFPRAIDVSQTVTALRQANPSAATFCFRFGHSAFVGATPEKLIRKQGLQLTTEALAGTFRKDSAEFAEELLRSPKEHAEHAPVLEAILTALTPLCSTIQHAAEPSMHELPNLLHLRTPVSGQLKSKRHILELVALLHPTPAVGGVPSDVATQWLTENEKSERGWYASPIGWFNSAGDGDFMVALRSGVIKNADAYLYAGAGIVPGSKPVDEYNETELKLRSLRASLRTTRIH